MPSPLEEIDWNNLQSASLVTAVNLLELAFSERVNMVQLMGHIIPAAHHTTRKDLYPWLNNTPKYGRDNWPLIWSNDTSFTSIILASYLSQAKIDAALGTVDNFNWSYYSQSEAQIFLENGITQWPKMDIVNPTNVKKWYDIITSLKKICVERERQGGSNYIESYAEGIFDFPPVTPTIGQVWYDGIFGPPAAQFTTDWALLFNGPQSKQLVSKISNLFNHPLSSSIRITSASDKRAYTTKGYSRFDNTAYVNTGLTGVPESIAYGHYNYNTVSGTYSPGLASASKEIIELPAVTRTTIGGNVLERSLDVPVLTEPTHTAPYTEFNLSTIYAIYENWDIEGGFIYYTP